METVTCRHNEVQSYVDQVNDKTLAAVEMEEERLQQRYFHLLNQLEKTKLQILKLEEKLRQQNDLDNHPQIKQIISDLSKVDQYRLALMNRTEQLTQQLQLNCQTIKQLKIDNAFESVGRFNHRSYVQRKLLLNRLQELYKNQQLNQQRFQFQSVDISSNRSNINLFITEQNTKKLSLSQLPPIYIKKQSKSQLIKVLSKATSGCQEQVLYSNKQPAHDIIEIYKQISILRKRIAEQKLEIKQKSNQFSSIRNLLISCLNISLKNFKNKQKVTNQNGYANSIYFDFSSTLNQSAIDNTYQSKKERKIQNILYDTLQQIMVNIIDESQAKDANGNPVANQAIRNSVTFEQFLQFSSEQILGLLALQPRLVKELTNVFEIKQKQLGLLGQKLKLYTKHV